MYKLMIVDDEPIVLKSLKFIIEKNFNNINIVETARTGREAIQKAETNVPDIIFMDIKMPGINGLDAIKEIKSRCMNTIFVILTAYGQFNFAKEAVNLGVIEYLLKPIAQEKVIETVQKAIDIVRSERENRQRELELKEKLESVIPALENGFICSLLFFDDNIDELRSYRQIFEIEQNGGYIMTIEFGESTNHFSMGNKIGMNIKSQLFYPALREVIKARCKCIIGPVMLNRIVVFIPAGTNDDEYGQRMEALCTARDILGQVMESLDVDFRIGLGKSYNDFENLPASYEESLRAIRYAEKNEVMHIMDVPEENETKYGYPFFKEKFFIEKAYQGNIPACIEAFNYLFDWLINEHGGYTMKVKSRLIGLFSAIQRLVWDYEEEDGEFAVQMGYFEEMLAFEDIAELKIWCRQKIEQIINSITVIREKRVSKVSLNAKNYINQNYYREISLEDVSREVNISPNYFSKIFKKETGKSFIDYLTFVRIQKAKELLKKNACVMKEICHLVGYRDPNYFSRIFKKVVGVTPSEYRENLQNEQAWGR